MKETQLHPKDETELHSVNEKKSTVKLVRTIKPQQGHKCFEFNWVTRELSYAKFKSLDYVIGMDDKAPLRKKIIMNDQCTYVSALNFKNAEKVIRREYNVLLPITIIKS